MRSTPLLRLGLLLIPLLLGGLAGCLGDDDEEVLRIAFTTKDDYENADADPQLLADRLADVLDMDVELYHVDSHGAAIEALRFGHADLAFLDGGAAWLGWQRYDLQTLVADQRGDGRTFYNSHAWVRNDSSITTWADLDGVDSCHTGWLKSAGMLMPMGRLIGENITPVVGDTEDIESLRTTVESFFGNASIPASGSPYYNYDGAMRCLSEGVGDVAFTRDSSYEEHCEGNDWCLARDEYRKLDTFGEVPTHPVMYAPDHLDADLAAEVEAALLGLMDETEGMSILANVLETPGLTAVDTEDHLGDYSDALSNIPGLSGYFDGKYDAA